MKEAGHHPPNWAQRFVEWYCKPELAEDLLGDLNEYFDRNTERIGARRAKIIYVIDAFKFLRSYTVRKPKIVDLFINWIMIGSYIKTSGRNVMRNKLFSSINIVGLAVSMSVGLLLIAFLHDLTSYDKFHEKGDRIYRIVSHPVFGKDDWGRFASTSLKAGRVIEEKVPGIEETTIIRSSFSGDAIIGDNIFPMEALWAEPSLFNVFSFPLVAGDKATALTDPYSIVLTEESAKKLFGTKEALGQSIRFDTVDYHVTGVMKNIPFFSHVKFEALISFSTFDQQSRNDRTVVRFDDMWSNYVYLLLPADADLATLRSHLDEIARTENASLIDKTVQLDIQPLHSIVLGENLSNSIGQTTHMSMIVTLIILAAVVILSACFNYTNLSIARSMRRFKEVGLRKAVGAGRNDVRQQFLYEAIIIALAALLLSFAIFLVLRPVFLNVSPDLLRTVRLDLTPAMVTWFIVFAIAVGVIAGFLPALFFARINLIHALKDASSVKVFKHLNLRKGLVVMQYSFTLMFITATVIGYTQYKGFVMFDLGFQTENIVNVKLYNNKPELVIKELSEIPEIVEISKSRLVTSLGNYYGSQLKYKNMSDSQTVWYNKVDENYLPLHGHKFVAGTNFIARPTKEDEQTEVIVNEQALKTFNIGDPTKPESALGEEVVMDGRKLSIVGVAKDFHYGRVDTKIQPVVFTYWTDAKGGFVNLKIQSTDLPATMTRIEQAWKEIDKVHPVEAKFYSEAIEDAYQEYSSMIQVVGFLSFLAISIASMGLFGMVVFTTETRLKEISIRKVMGASSGNLVVLLSRGFLILLSVSALIALPATYILFDQMILTDFPYHSPIGIPELFVGLLGVLIIAFLMIGSQTMKAARSNPAEVLKNE